MRYLILLTLVAALGCPSVDKDPPVEVSALALAVFAPDSSNRCASELPFPSDLSKNPVTGRLDLPLCEDDLPTSLAAKIGLNTLDGFSLATTMTAPFSEPVDITGLDAAILVINAQTGATHPVASDYDIVDNTVVIVPLEPFAEATRYVVGISDSLKTEDGDDIVSDQAFTLIKSGTPLVDSDRYSRIALDDASANGLEALRMLWHAPVLESGQPGIFQALADAGMAKENVLVAWDFTTQTVSDYPALAAMVAGTPAVTRDNVLPASAHPLLASAGIPFNNLCDLHTGRIELKSLIGDTGTFVVGADGLPVVENETASYILITPNLDTYWDGTSPPPVDFCTTDWLDAGVSARNIVVFAHTLSRCKTLALAVANTLAQASPPPFPTQDPPEERWAVLAVDGPRAGGRSIAPLGDQDLDTCPDQGPIPEIFAAPGEVINPFGIRDRMRQWGLELHQIASAAKADVRPFVGADTTGDAPTINVSMLGHSWGGMAAVLAGAISADNIESLAVSTASGDYGDIFAPLVRGTTAAVLAAQGITPTTPGYAELLARGTAETLAVFRWSTEPGDPFYLARGAYPGPTNMRVLAQVVAAGGDMADADLHFASTQSKLAAALEAAGHDFQDLNEFAVECAADGGTTQAICADNLGAVGIPLQPCAADPSLTTGDDLALAKTTSAQLQLVKFITSRGTQIVTGAQILGQPETLPCQ